MISSFFFFFFIYFSVLFLFHLLSSNIDKFTLTTQRKLIDRRRAGVSYRKPEVDIIGTTRTYLQIRNSSPSTKEIPSSSSCFSFSSCTIVVRLVSVIVLNREYLRCCRQIRRNNERQDSRLAINSYYFELRFLKKHTRTIYENRGLGYFEVLRIYATIDSITANVRAISCFHEDRV